MTPYIFHFYFRGFGLVLAVTGKCFSLLCIFSVRFRASPLMTTKNKSENLFLINTQGCSRLAFLGLSLDNLW